MKRKFLGIPQECFSIYEYIALFSFVGIVGVCIFFEIDGTPEPYLRVHAWLWFAAAVCYCASFGRPLAEMGTVDGALRKQCIYYVILVLAILIFGFTSIGRLTSPPLISPSQQCPLPIEGYYVILIGVVSAMMLGLGWLIQFSLEAKAERRQHTIRVLLDSRMSIEFQKQMENFRAFYRPTEEIGLEDAKWCFSKDSKNIPADDVPKQKKFLAIMANNYLLNFYEFLAVGIKYRDLDEKVLKDVLKSVAINLHKRSVHVIAFCQEKTPSLHTEFQALVRRWENDN